MASEPAFRRAAFGPFLVAIAFASAASVRADDAVMSDGDKPAAPVQAQGSPDAKGGQQDRRSPRQDRKPRPDETDAEREQREAMDHMGRMLAMSDAQIGRMSSVLRSLEKIPVEHRAELRKRLELLRRASPAEREAFLKELREKYGLFEEPRPARAGDKQRRDPGVRNLLDKHFATMAPDAADVERKRFLAMSRDEKIAYIKALRDKYGIPEEPRPEMKKKTDNKSDPKPDGRSASAPRPPKGDPFGA